MIEETELFNDLPEEETITPEEQEDIKNLSKAEKAEKSRLEDARKKLEEARAERKKVENELKKVDEEPVPVPAPVPTMDVSAEVAKALAAEKRKQYLEQVASAIRAKAKNRQEAVEAYEEASRFEPSGDAALDAEFAIERRNKIRQAKGQFVPPPVSGSFAEMGIGEDKSPLGLSKFQAEHAKSYGLTDDDIRKHKDGVNFKRLFNKSQGI